MASRLCHCYLVTSLVTGEVGNPGKWLTSASNLLPLAFFSEVQRESAFDWWGGIRSTDPPGSSLNWERPTQRWVQCHGQRLEVDMKCWDTNIPTGGFLQETPVTRLMFRFYTLTPPGGCVSTCFLDSQIRVQWPPIFSQSCHVFILPDSSRWALNGVRSELQQQLHQNKSPRLLSPLICCRTERQKAMLPTDNAEP